MTLCFIIFFRKLIPIKVYNKQVTLVSLIALEYPNYKKDKRVTPKTEGVW